MGYVEVKYLPAETVADILRSSERDRVQVIDVRDDDFDTSGHIRGAMNLPQPFFSKDENIDGVIRGLISQGKRRIIFHCWLSQQRGPWCADRFAKRLEQCGGTDIDYVNVLKNGYKRFSRLYLNETDLVDLSSVNSTVSQP
uniref:Rhodanese-like protein n=1 Tax=Tetraselmis sp. GSL018 TaxID=582737 RepID=A0A061RFC9_9CHLO